MLLVQNSLLNRKTKNIYFSFFSCPFLFNASGNFNNLVDDGEGAWKQSATATGRQKQKVEGPAYLSAWLLDPNLRRSEARVDDL